MRRHNVEKAGFCLGVAEGLESIEMGTGDVHKHGCSFGLKSD
jgi:hypothetical protein